MKEAGLARSEAGTSPHAVPAWRGRAFGIDVEATFPIRGVREAEGENGRFATSMELVLADELEHRWRNDGAEPVLTRTFPDGRVVIQIERHETLGYRVHAPGHGRHLVSPDGSRLLSVLTQGAAWRWQRLLFAQVLPLCATLQGVDLFHASSVALGGRVIAFVAPSGTGKTSIAAHLVAKGATPVTDDVLALEPSGEQVLAHPGACLSSLSVHEWEGIPASERPHVGRIIGRSEKLHLATEPIEGPQPLSAIYFLQRTGGAEFTIHESSEGSSWPLLASSFISYVDSARHLAHHLEVCAQVDRVARTYDVSFPLSLTASDVAERIRDHAQES